MVTKTACKKEGSEAECGCQETMGRQTQKKEWKSEEVLFVHRKGYEHLSKDPYTLEAIFNSFNSFISLPGSQGRWKYEG